MSIAPEHLQHRRRRIVVEIDFGVGEIGQDEDAVPLRERHQLLVEVEIGDVGRRVRRIADHDGDRFRDRMDDRALQRGEECRRRLGRHRTDHAACHQEAERVDRIARIGHQDHVTRRSDGLRHVGEAFLGAERGDDLRFGVQLHAEPARVIGCLGTPQTGNTLRCRIAVGARLAERLLELVDHVLWRRQVRIAHAEIDDVGAGIASGRLGAVHLLEYIGRQAPDAVKFFHRQSLRMAQGQFVLSYHGLWGASKLSGCSTAGPSSARRPMPPGAAVAFCERPGRRVRAEVAAAEARAGQWRVFAAHARTPVRSPSSSVRRCRGPQWCAAAACRGRRDRQAAPRAARAHWPAAQCPACWSGLQTSFPTSMRSRQGWQRLRRATPRQTTGYAPDASLSAIPRSLLPSAPTAPSRLAFHRGQIARKVRMTRENVVNSMN